MKSIATLLIICLIGCITACQGQTTQETSQAGATAETAKSDSGKPMNLLDEQTKMYGKIFDLAGEGEDNPLGGAENYIELLDKIDLPEDQKEMLLEQYKIYDLSLDPKKKDSLKLLVNKMMTEAIEKSKNDPDN